MRLFAYLDPGTGAIIVQAILGGTAGVAVLFKTFGRRFSRKPKTDESETMAFDETDEPSSKPSATD